MVGVQKSWSTTAASNATADGNINYAEGQTPASLNDAARAQMAALKGFANQISGAKTTGGSANAQTLTSDSVAAISTAYAAGMIFCVKAGYTNSTTTPTFNVDGVGAKTIKKGGAQAALAVGDITAGGVYWLAYEASGDCFLLLNPDSGPVSAQPLDATLTALAALSWSSGNALVQFTAADTVSLTLTPSVTDITLSGLLKASAGSNSAPSITFTGDPNTGLFNQSADQLNTTVGGVLSSTWFSGGFQLEGSALLYVNTGTAGSPGLSWRIDPDSGFYRIGANNLGLALNGAKYVDFATTLIAFSAPVQSRVPLSSETSGTLTVASANKKVVCTGNVTLDDGVFTADDFILFDPGTSARTFTRAAGLTMYVNGADSASATLAANQIGSAQWRSASVVELVGAFS